jgi:hydrogenase nickel incorporation protein HypA/HybF
MHELAIAQNIFDIVRQSVPEDQAPSVRRVRMRIGKLSGVIPESLDFCFTVIAGQSPMRRAALAIEEVPTVFRCRDCGNSFGMEDLAFICPQCKSNNLEMISGRELEIVEVELQDDGDESP